jgi:hypothetical protein
MSVFPKQRAALLTASVGLFALVVSWFLLNRLRVHFYMYHHTPNNSYYWSVVRIQDWLLWPIGFFAVCFVVLLLCEVAGGMISAIRLVFGSSRE